MRASQNRAAQATGQSPALVSMVLNRRIKSQPCLDKLAAFITVELTTIGQAKAS